MCYFFRAKMKGFPAWPGKVRCCWCRAGRLFWLDQLFYQPLSPLVTIEAIIYKSWMTLLTVSTCLVNWLQTKCIGCAAFACKIFIAGLPFISHISMFIPKLVVLDTSSTISITVLFHCFKCLPVVCWIIVVFGC